MRKPGARRSTELERLASEPLLSDEQRVALDAALAKKAAERDDASATINGVPPELAAADPAAGKASRGGKQTFFEGIKTKRDLAHDHHLTRRGHRGATVKKGGRGGRFNWGTALDPTDYTDPGRADRGDPNYDSAEEAYVASSLTFAEERSTQIAAYKAAVVSLLQEYFASGDLKEVALALVELDHPEFGHFFVKKAVTAALDRHDREREMTSVLLSTLYNEVLSPEDMRRGFADLVASVDDLSLDVPDAAELIALFACRAVADDALPPAYLRRIEGPPGSSAAAFRHKCEAHLDDQHFAERMGRAWGHGAGFKLTDTKESIAAMLKEYFSASGDAGEVRRLLRDLAVPFFHHEVVKQALVKGMEGRQQMEAALSLLRRLADSNDVSSSQMTKGYQRVADALEDTQLDNPGAPELFASAVAAATEGSWLEEGWTPMPTPSSAPGTPSAKLSPASGGGAAPWANGRGPSHPTVQAFKAAALDITREYFDSGDVDEVARRLQELEEPGFHNIFVKHAVQLSLDRKDREREMVSALLAALCPAVVASDQVALGFTRLLAGADDLALDIPDAARLLSLFLGRAIVDEALSPRFLAEVVPSLTAAGLGVGIVQAAGAMLSARHAAERFACAWHGGGTVTGGAGALESAMDTLVKEYVASGDEAEASRCLADLGAPHYHHELVVRAVLVGLNEPAEDGVAALRLLRHLSESGEITQTQLAKGFRRLKDDLEDIKLDYVKAPDLVPAWEAQAMAEGWLQDANAAPA